MRPPTSTAPVHPCRRLIVVLGDQLDVDSTVFEGFDPELDWIWMAEVSGEATHVWNSVSGSHWSFGDRADLGLAAGAETLASQLALTLDRLRPAEVHAVEPGEWRLKDQLQEVARTAGIPWVTRPDQHFFSSPDDFAAHARGRKQLRLEFFYRELRQRTGFLMDGDQPAGGQWNYDAENRESFGKQGPGFVPAPRRLVMQTPRWEGGGNSVPSAPGTAGAGGVPPVLPLENAGTERNAGTLADDAPGRWDDVVAAWFAANPQALTGTAQGLSDLARAMCRDAEGNDANYANYKGRAHKLFHEFRAAVRLPNGDKIGTDITGGA